MRRRGSKPLPRLPEPGERTQPGIALRWRVVLPLRVVTPIIGGGVGAREPDTVDIVRLPQVRGLLRWWWRALFHPESEDAEPLFRREARLWGGVEVPSEKPGEDNASVRSRVRLGCWIADPGRVMPAGRHEPGRDGQAKAMPTWTLGRNLGYALFPLQRERDERQGHSSIPTRPVRSGVRFELTVDVVPEPISRDEKDKLGPEESRRREQESLDRDVPQVLRTLWAWTHLGGLGARTRRGFGALALDGAPSFPDGASEDGLFPTNFETGWQQLLNACAEGSRLDGAKLLLGQAERDASAAHEAGVGELFTFRQGVGTGREAGRRRPGASRWPEPGLLRGLHQSGWRAEPEDFEGRGAPRAAFGMPLIIQFKGERGVDASLVPEHGGGDRWASPVLLRPCAVAGGSWRPVVLILGGERPVAVRVEPQDRRAPRPPGAYPVQSSIGARGEIEKLLTAARGDALRAFAAWLQRQRGYRPVGGGGER